MKSIWKPGTRVRVKAIVADGTAGLTGTVERVNYAEVEESTSVLLDNPDGGFDALGAFFEDHELEAE